MHARPVPAVIAPPQDPEKVKGPSRNGLLTRAYENTAAISILLAENIGNSVANDKLSSSSGASIDFDPVLSGKVAKDETTTPVTRDQRFGATPEEWVHFAAISGLAADLLPVVSNPHAVISERSSLKSLGKSPSTYNQDRNVVGFPGWATHHATDVEVTKWALEPDYGICVQCRILRVIDIDIEDPDIVADLCELVKVVLGNMPIRRRANSSKCAMVFWMHGEFKKLKFRAAAGGAVEFLATGQQFVAAGTHPSGARYEWAGGLPASEDIPTLGADEFEQLWDALRAQYAVADAKSPSGREAFDNVAAKGDFDRQITLDQVTAETVEDVHTVMDVFTEADADGRELWVDMGHALKSLAQAGHEDAALAMWLEFSARSTKHTDSEANEKWQGFRPTDITYKSIFKWAAARGRENPKRASVMVDVVVDLENAPDAPRATPKPIARPFAPSTYPEPFPGPHRAAVEATLRAAAKPQPELTCLAVLIGMASGCAGCFRLPSGMRTNLYGLAVGDTGSGKDATLKAASEVGAAVGTRQMGNPASGQGLEDALTSEVAMLMVIDEIGHTLQASGGKNAPAHLIELSRIILALYSAGSATWHTRLRAAAKSNPTARAVPHPCLNVYGVTTPEKLGAAVGSENITDGLLGRMLFAMGQSVAHGKSGRCELPPDFLDAAECVRQARIAADFGVKDAAVDVTFAPSAEDAADQLRADMDPIAARYEGALERLLLARSYEKVERVAAVLAIWQDPVRPAIGLDHLEWAARLVRASNAQLLYFSTSYMHEGGVQRDAAKVKDIMARLLAGQLVSDKESDAAAILAGWVLRSTVLKRSKLDATRLKLAIEYLQQCAEIQVGKSKPDDKALMLRIISDL
jgi:hypothetical protein